MTAHDVSIGRYWAVIDRPYNSRNFTSDRGDCLFLRCASRNLFLNGIANIHQHLTKATELLTSFPRVCGNGTMAWNKDVRAQAFDCIQRLKPIESVTVIDKQKLIGKKQLAQIDNAVLRNVYDAVTSRVSATYIEYLNFFSAKMERDPLTIGLIRKSRFLLLGRRLLPLH